MMQLQLTLDFECCCCGNPVTVTLQCTGKDLNGQTVAVNVPCPTCGQINQLLFEPQGGVQAVRPYPAVRAIPEPSVN
jgi:hypothetical protein